jgi:rhomboid protease GluP
MVIPVVTWTLSLLMVSILLAFWTGTFTELPCNPDYISTIARNFIHVQAFHILANLFAFYQMREIELQLGVSSYILLILALVFVQSTIEFILSSYVDLGCSIGFSGVLYGLLVWMLMSTPSTNRQKLVPILISIVVSSLAIPNVSLSGHLIGFVSGLIVAKLSLIN